ncbi:MAG: hypothetical protein ACK5HP_03740 [Bacilli bacterium]
MPRTNNLFLSLVFINILIKNNKIHKAHGLNPSTKPIAIVIIGSEKSTTLISPKIGIVKLGSSSTSLVIVILSFFSII